MRLTIAAIGRLKRGAEAELVDRFLSRAVAIGRGLAVELQVRELPEARAERAVDRSNREGEALRSIIPDGALMVALDERGRLLSSGDFADLLRSWRDRGTRDVAFLIGGADGLGEALRSSASVNLSLGPMTWPHQLARALLLEQVYRALSVLAGHPYHRG